ncbi:MAG: aspartate ammonia-lyase [Micrococcales bacterium]
MKATRLEHDIVGELEIPEQAYWGIHTARAVENFPITGVSIGHYHNLIKALAQIKAAAAKANYKVGALDQKRMQAIVDVCSEIEDGKHHRQFVVDAIQGGAGTSTNMNANEVIANLAIERLGANAGDYEVLHPLNDVNMSQSTNDVYPTAIKVALIYEIRLLMKSLTTLQNSYRAKGKEFAKVLKMGRTQLQDAVPMSLGQEFEAYAVTTGEDIERLGELIVLLSEINLGGTAIGTRINAPAGYVEAIRAELSELVGVEFSTAKNLVEATQDAGVFVTVSGVLKRVAVKQSKISNDLRLLSSGPRAGFNEINLPPRQAGSSIMPGKVNPVIPEVMNQIAFTVIGNDLTVTLACEAGQLELNAFEPVIARSLLMSITYLRQGCATLTKNCIDGITANEELLKASVVNSIGLVTALSPSIGYENATAIAKHAQATGNSVRKSALELGILTAEEFDALLGNLEALIGPNS